MKLLLRAAVSVFSMGIASAYANEGGPAANTLFTDIPGVIAQAPVQNAPAFATAQSGQAVQTYATQSGRGTWLFPPSLNGATSD